MSNTRTHLKKIKDLLDKIEQKRQLKEIFLDHEAEDLSIVPVLIQLVGDEINHLNQFTNSNVVTPNAFEKKVTEFLHSRWQSISNTQLCYTQNMSYPLNQACVWLAEYLSSQEKNLLLMPTVMESDIFGYEFNELQLGEFIINDAKNRFITLEGLVQSACARMMNGEAQLYVTTDDNGREIPLSQTELSRFGNAIKLINAIQSWYQHHQSNLYNKLVNLRDCLLQGDAHHEGEELNAGSQANIGIADFYALYAMMSEEDKGQIRKLSDVTGQRTLGYVFDQLFRPAHQNYRNTSYCIAILGRMLQGIIEKNAVALSGMNVSEQFNLENLIKFVKSQLCREEIAPNNQNQNRRSRVNPDLEFNEHEWVVSFIAPENTMMSIQTKIIVEGIQNGKLFVGSYYAIAKTPSQTWSIIPAQLTNTAGIFSKIKVFESTGYAQIAQSDSNNHIIIDDNGKIAFKFDQISELRNSLSRSHQVPVENCIDMINSIKRDADNTNFANWIAPIHKRQNEKAAIDRIVSNRHLYSLFIPFERFGSESYFGTGKDNCVTWCERKLKIAGCGLNQSLDAIKAKPLTHVKLW